MQAHTRAPRKDEIEIDCSSGWTRGGSFFSPWCARYWNRLGGRTEIDFYLPPPRGGSRAHMGPPHEGRNFNKCAVCECECECEMRQMGEGLRPSGRSRARLKMRARAPQRGRAANTRNVRRGEGRRAQENHRSRGKESERARVYLTAEESRARLPRKGTHSAFLELVSGLYEEKVSGNE